MDMSEENKCGENSGGQEWRWCLAGNIVGAHGFGEEHEIRYGTKHFAVGTKVYLYHAFPGMGNENIVAIGIPRNGRNYIEVVIRTKYIENFRCQKCFKPAVLNRMENSNYCSWLGNSEDDRKEAVRFADIFNARKENDEDPKICGKSEKGTVEKSEGDKSDKGVSKAFEKDVGIGSAENRRLTEAAAGKEKESGVLYELRECLGIWKRAFKSSFGNDSFRRL
ncbi:MAG: hypothetical protein K2K57_05465 [Oscillospiraceae bacterium]|nr:hypothetical protein [Oscillospiraceae bacterium]